MSRSARALVVIALALAVAGFEPRPALADDPLRIKITQLDASSFPEVRVVASVADAQDRPLGDLTPSDLVVTEEGRPQSPSVELTTKNAPVALALVLDTSGSMSGRPLADAKAGMGVLLRSLGDEDLGAVVTFNTTPTVGQSLTSDKAALLAAIDSANAGGNTAILDAVMLSIDALAAAPQQARRAIVLLTDGIDNSSGTTLRALTERLRALSYPLYVIGLGNNLDRALLQTLADATTGGQALVAPTSQELASIYAALGQRILAQYLVLYRSNARNAPDGTSLTITLEIVRAGTILGVVSATITVPPGRGVTVPTPVPAPVLVPVAVALPGAGEDGPYSAELVALLGTATVLSLVLWLVAVTTTRSLESQARRRLHGLRKTEDVMALERTGGRSFWQRAALPLLMRMARPLGQLAGGFMLESARRRLQQAGEPLELGPVEFLGLEIGGALASAASVAALGLLAIGPQPGWIALLGVAGAFVGLAVPSIVLDRMTRARKRRILRALPSALDMLAVSTRAGLTFDGAVAQVTQRWESPLTDEFRRLLAEFRVGRDRGVALRSFAQRTGVPEVTRFATAIVQAGTLGVPISAVLKDQALDMRTRRRQQAEEAARKAPIKMLFPMVGLIFPALFVVILGPAVPHLLDIFRIAQ